MHDRENRWKRERALLKEMEAAGIIAQKAEITKQRKLKNTQELAAATTVLERLVKQKEAVDKRQEERAAQAEFNARVEAVFKALDSNRSGELAMAEMEATFGEETHDYWANIDGEACVWCRVEVATMFASSQYATHVHNSGVPTPHYAM